MYQAHTGISMQQTARLRSARWAKRRGGWLALAWLVMWISAALLPCSEVAAAMAYHATATTAHADCGQSAGSRKPDSRGGKQHNPCASIAAPTYAQTARPAAAGASPLVLVAIAPASSYVLTSPPGLSFPIAHRAAPPPTAVYLRNLRLLI